MRHEDPKVALIATRDILDRVIGCAPKAPEDLAAATEGLLALVAMWAQGKAKP
jgi:hypothetical protein